MFATQKQVLESFGRVRAFLDAHPVPGPLGEAAHATFDDAMQRIRAYAGQQESGRALSRGELRQRVHLIRRLMNCHMRPIVTIARAQIEPDSDVALSAAFRMPRAWWSVTRILQACYGMLEVAHAFESALIAHGMPADFLAQFEQARDELERVVSTRAGFIRTHVGARAGLSVQLRRARRAVDRLDAAVRIEFEGDEVVLTAWRSAKRVHGMPGRRGASVEADAVAPVVALEVRDLQVVQEAAPAAAASIRLVA